MSTFEERRAARIERFKELAGKAAAEAEGLQNKARRMADCIPFGQPILVGHHSEHRDRRFRDRIHNTFGKAFDTHKKAEYYAQRARSAEKNQAIFSDDPEAIDKLKNKLYSLEHYQARMVAINKAWRKAGKPKPNDAEAWERIGKDPNIVTLRIGPEYLGNVRVSMAKDFIERAPFSYHTTNNSGEINRLKKRIELLEGQKGRETKEHELPGDIRIVENVEDNRVQVFFPDIPTDEVRAKFKARGFKWSQYNGCWQRHLNDYAVWLAKELITTDYR